MHDNTVDFEKIFSKMLDDFRNFENYSFENFPLYGIVISTCLNLKWLFIL